MKIFNLLVIQFILSVLMANAQDGKSYFDSDAYAHTIVLDEYKITMFVMPLGGAPKIIKHDRRYAWFSGNRINYTQGGYSGRLLHGAYSEHFDGNGLKCNGKYSNGLKDGEWKFWSKNGRLDSVVNYTSGILTGKFEKFNVDGDILESGSYRRGLIDGKVRRWVNKDSLRIVYFKNGKQSEKKQFKPVAALRRLFKLREKNNQKNGVSQEKH